MKRSTRLLSVLLAFVFLFNLMMPAAQAMEFDNKGNRVFTADEAAKMLLDYADSLLATEGDRMAIDLIDLTIDYTSVDKALASLEAIGKKKIGFVSALKLIGGDFSNLDLSVLYGVRRSGGDVNVLNKLFEFLSKNKYLVQKLVKGQKLDFGAVKSFIKEDIQFDVTAMAKEALYDGMLKKSNNGVKYLDSKYKAYTADQLLTAGLQDLLKKEFDFIDVTKVNVSDPAFSFYSILNNYLGLFYKNMDFDSLNKDFKATLANLAEVSYDKNTNKVTKTSNTNKFFDVIDWQYAFDANTYDFDEAFKTRGLVEQLNDIIYAVFDTILTDKAFGELGLVKGNTTDGTVFNKNIERLARFILPLCPAKFFNGTLTDADLTPEAVAKLDFTELVTLAMRAVLAGAKDFQLPELGINLGGFEDVIMEVLNGLLSGAASMELPDKMDSIEKFVAYALKSYAKTTLPYDSYYSKSLATAVDNEDYMNVAMDIVFDIVVKYADDLLPIDLPEKKVKAYKDKGWGWEAFLDEIIDWVLNDYLNGLLSDALTIPAAQCRRGEKDNVWGKINTLINGLLPLEMLNMQKVDGIYDMQAFVKKTLLENLGELDFSSMLGVLAKNNNSGNILNMNLITGVLTLVQRILNSIFPNTIQNTDIDGGLEKLIKGDTLSGIVGRLLDSLNARKGTLLPALLPIVGSLMFDQMKPTVSVGIPKVYNPTATKTDFWVVSTFTQKTAAELFGLAADAVASGKLESGTKYKDYKIQEMGTIVALKSTMDAKKWTTLDLGKVSAANKVYSAVSTALYTDKAKADGSGEYFFATTIKDVALANYDKPFVAVGYVKYKTASGAQAVLYTPAYTYTVGTFAR